MNKYFILDTETTGIDTEDRVIQLGYIEIDGKNTKAYEDFCSCDIPIKLEAMETHHILESTIKDKPKLTECDSFKYLSDNNNPDNYLIIHNAPFDIGMLEKDGFENKMKLIDTLRCSKHLYPDNKAHRLQYFRYQLEIFLKEQEEADKLGIVIKAHDALGDVLILKLFMTELVNKIKKDFPNEHPIEKLVALTKEIPLIKRMPFGKHKDELIEDVVKQDIGWINWALSNMEDLSEELKFTFNHFINLKNNPQTNTTNEVSPGNKFLD